MRVLEAAQDAEVGPIQLELEGVLAVERERVANQRAAHGAERQTVEVPILGQVLANAVGLGRRPVDGSPMASALIFSAAAR